MRTLFAVILIVLLRPVEAQDFIGLTEKRIKEIMTAEKSDLTIDNQVRNNTYRYLKYHSGDDRETWVIFLDGKGRCQGVRITCDNRSYEGRIKELNDLYGQADDNSWSYKTGGSEINIVLKRESWFFTLTYEPAKQKR
jgi:hypothetical protein